MAILPLMQLRPLRHLPLTPSLRECTLEGDTGRFTEEVVEEVTPHMRLLPSAPISPKLHSEVSTVPLPITGTCMEVMATMVMVDKAN